MCTSLKEKLRRLLIPLLVLSGVLTVCIIIIQFVIGIIYNGQCPMQPLVPIYNLVSGSVGIAIIILSCVLFVTIRLKKNTSRYLTIPLITLLALLGLFEVTWGTLGGYYTIPLRKNNITQFENSQLPTYCQPILYWISFVILIIYFSVLSLAGVDAAGVLQA